MNAVSRCGPSTGRQRQQGVATLIVVLILFFVVSLVAAYTNRNLIFEQRTATNQYRSSQALETAEAGLEWAESMLNTGRVTDACASSTDVTDPPFRERYLNISNTGRVTPDLDPSGNEISAACVFNGTGWTCSCPSGGVGTVSSPSSTGQWPAFRVRFLRVGGSAASPPPATPRQPGVIKVEVVGCTRADGTGLDTCLSFAGQGALGEGRAIVSSLMALTGGPSSPPQAALTARDDVDVSGSGFFAYNSIAGGTGVTVHAGGSVNGYDQLVGQAGSPGGPATVIANDPAFTLTAVSGTGGITTQDRMFAAVFNMRPDTFRDQQAGIVIDCPVSGCAIQTIRDKANFNPWRPIWLNGDLNANSSGALGSAAAPVLLVVNGDLKFSVSGVNIFGMVYVRIPSGSSRWETDGAGQITGAAVSDNRIRGDGTTNYVFDPDVMNLLRWNTGSFVRVPSSWKDFQ